MAAMKLVRIKLTGKYIIDADSRLPRVFDEEGAKLFCMDRSDLDIVDYSVETVNGGLKP